MNSLAVTLSFATACLAQYGPGGQYGPDSSGSGSSGSSSGSSGSSGFNQNDIPFGGDEQKGHMVTLVHGVLASLAFVIFFPVGAILIRLASFRGLIWVHAAFQVLAYVLFIAGAGLGIYLAMQTRQLNKAHPIIGLTLLGVTFFQPILGLLHHYMFKKYSRRVVWSYGHIWLGRAIITLGMINGGLGLQLARNSVSGEIAYGIIAGLIWLTYVASAIYGEMKRRKARKNGPAPYDKAGVRQGSESDVLPGDHRSETAERSPNRNHEYYAKPEPQNQQYV